MCYICTGGSKLLGEVLNKSSMNRKHLERLVSMTMEPPGCDGDEVVQVRGDVYVYERAYWPYIYVYVCATAMYVFFYVL
jgi:hypothetical protein